MRTLKNTGIYILCSLLVGSALANAEPLNESSPIWIAQSEGTDAYDPFADYSEFESSEEEEAYINFFRNGRFFTLGFIGGYRTFTETMGDIISDSV
ncbi:MAG: hypothetical protein KDD22_00530, partial [Bdellovibrionales bacterium]|nr:hypothetical protein [Bdellovibrionales bacterium]